MVGISHGIAWYRNLSGRLRVSLEEGRFRGGTRAMVFSSDVNRISDRLQLSSRFALAVGFGGLIAIMALAGVDALRVLRQIRRDDDQIRRQFLFRNHLLN